MQQYISYRITKMFQNAGLPPETNMWVKRAGLAFLALTVVPWAFGAPPLAGPVIALSLAAIAAYVKARTWQGKQRKDGADPTIHQAVMHVLRTQKRHGEVRAKWNRACQRTGLTAGGKDGKPLTIHNITETPEGDIRFFVPCARDGVKVGEVQKEADRIRGVMGSKKAVVVPNRHRDGVTVNLYWTDPLERTIPLSHLPRPKAGHVSYGVRADGSPAQLDLSMSAIIGGMTGHGKSTCIWSMCASLVHTNTPVELWVSDPKGGMELSAFGEHLNRGTERFKVVRYSEDLDDTVKMVEEFDRIRAKRATELKASGQRKGKYTLDHPLRILLLDETLLLSDILKLGSKGALGRIAFAGRASNDVVWACTQLAQKTSMGDFRDLVPQRVSFRQANATNTNMVLGDGAEAVAPCSQIRERGLGFSYDDRSGVFSEFRGTMVTDEEVAFIARGELPPSVRADIRPCAVYEFYDGYGDRVYIGKSVDPEQRFKEHARDANPEWYPRIRGSRIVGWFDSEDEALAVEQELIVQHKPVGNVVHNPDRKRARIRRARERVGA